MNALVKKEVRLLLPSWAFALLLALPPICTRSDDGVPIFLLLFGMALMALTSIGRETSLNTFSQLLAQPAERMRIWQTKLSVLAIAFLTVSGVWLLATMFSFKDYGGSPADAEATEAVLVAGCLGIAATFSGGLWATLLLRQVAGAFWLTLLVPSVLAGFTAAFLSETQSPGLLIGTLCVILGIYSVGGFLFARWLFFRAQDVGWTGGIIALPQLKFFSARSEAAGSIRKFRPVATLLKKEFQLQQVSLMGAAALLVLHIGVIVLRSNHQFPKESAGEVLTAIFWMFWLVLPVLVGAMSIAEERRLGVIEGQLCLPASRRMQFTVKALVTLGLGIFLGGVMPVLLETIAVFGTYNPMFRTDGHIEKNSILLFQVFIISLSMWLSLVSFFGSSHARNFLQAIGFAIATFMFSSLVFPIFASGRMIFFDSLPRHSLLPLFIAVPVLFVTFLWLAYLNFKNFRDGWHLWRRSVLVVLGAMLFTAVSSAAVYNRVWECFEPAEPAHGAARLSLAHPPVLRVEGYGENVLVQLPDGRVWFDFLKNEWWGETIRALFPSFPQSGGPQRFISGSNWVCATAQHVDTWIDGTGPNGQRHFHIVGYGESFGIQPDGTLWASEKSDQNQWTADKLTQFDNKNDWKQAVASGRIGSVMLLKRDGTLWQWGRGTNVYDWEHWPQNWPGLRAFQPVQIGRDSDWKEFFESGGSLVRKNDGTVWGVWSGGQIHETNYDQFPSQKNLESHGHQVGAYVRDDGSLWLYGDLHCNGHGAFETLRSGQDTNWVAVAVNYNWLVALKSDGTLWKWDENNQIYALSFTATPTRLGIHNDWVAISTVQSGVVTLAADGSLWFWPCPEDYRYANALLKLPKQPQWLGNVFGHVD